MTLNNKKNLFVDSGAFSAWNQGTEVNVENYINFIKNNLDVIDQYANLDVISDATATLKNQYIMEKAGLHPIPVFHYGSDESYLKKYCKEYNYISLGGMVPINTRNLILWLDKLYSKYLTNKKGYPITKIHGFGITSAKLMRRYPWYSVDSTSWAAISRMGAIIIPKLKGSKWDYNKQHWILGTSSKSPYKSEITKHINNLTPIMKEMALEYIHFKGYSLGHSIFKEVSPDYKLQENEVWFEKGKVVEVINERGVSNDHKQRNELNILYYQDLANSMPDWPWPFKKKTRKGFII